MFAELLSADSESVLTTVSAVVTRSYSQSYKDAELQDKGTHAQHQYLTGYHRSQ